MCCPLCRIQMTIFSCAGSEVRKEGLREAGAGAWAGEQNSTLWKPCPRQSQNLEYSTFRTKSVLGNDITSTLLLDR